MQYAWLAILAISLVAEAMTTDLVAIWFFPASLAAAILAFCDVPWYVQVLVFLVLGLALLVFTRPLCKKWLESKREKTGTDALIGRTALVTEEISNIVEQGEVRVGGLCWSARTEEDGIVIPAGVQVTVLEIKGVKMIVLQIENKENQ